MPRISLAANLESNDVSTLWTASQVGQFVQNGVFRALKNDITKEISVMVAPASTNNVLLSPGGSGENRAVHVWVGLGDADNVVSARGNTNSEIFEDTTSRGSITGLVKFFNETKISGTANLLIVSDANKGYFFPTGGAITEITDGDFPANAGKTLTGNFVPLDGWHSIMATDGTFYTSDLNSMSGWTANVFSSAQDSPDAGVGLAKWRNNLVCCGTNSIEFHENRGNASGSPYSRITGGTIDMGVTGDKAIVQFMDTVAVVGQSKGRSTGVYLLRGPGQDPQKISSDFVDEFITTIATNELALRLWADRGKILLGLQQAATASNSKLLLWDQDTNIWSQWSGSGGVRATDIRNSSTAGANIGMTAVYAAADGQVYIIRNTNPKNGGLAMTIQLRKNDAGSRKRKFCAALMVSGRGDGGAGVVSASYADQQSTTYSTPKSITLNGASTGHRFGSFYQRSWKIDVAADELDATQWLEYIEPVLDVAA